ncbi:MAG: hypothetical protein JW904_07425 [Spirochaetales bacterium]|nr:hypothetical protein [Spirochaetales bacterium]
MRFEPVSIAVWLKTAKNPPLEKLVEASLAFSGVPDTSLAVYTEKMDRIITEVKTRFKGREKTKELADELLVFLHEKYLKRYSENETLINTLLDKGLYNCVSSAVFYMLAAHALDISVSGVLTSSHAFCLVTIDGKQFDVETTSKYGFDPHGKREFLDEFGTQTGYVYVPPTNYRDRTTIGQIHLLTLILNNRIALAGTKAKLDEAFSAAVDMFEVLQSDEAFRTLSGTLSNISLDAVKRKKYEDGLEVMDKAVFAFREFPELAEVRRLYILDWAGGLVNANKPDDAEEVALRMVATGKISQDDLHILQMYIAFKRAEIISKKGEHHTALEIIEEAIKTLGSTDELQHARTTYTKNTVIEYITKKDYPASRTLLDEAQKTGVLDKRAYEELLVYYYLKKAEDPAKQKLFRDAVEVLNKGLKYLPKNNKLFKAGAAYAYNHAAGLLREKRFDEAEEFLSDVNLTPYMELSKRNELWVYFYTEKASIEKTENGYFPAARILHQGIMKLGKLSQLVKTYEIYIHNGVVSLIDDKRFGDAEKVLIDAIAVLPASSTLKKDLETVRRMMQ